MHDPFDGMFRTMATPKKAAERASLNQRNQAQLQAGNHLHVAQSELERNSKLKVPTSFAMLDPAQQNQM